MEVRSHYRYAVISRMTADEETDRAMIEPLRWKGARVEDAARGAVQASTAPQKVLRAARHGALALLRSLLLLPFVVHTASVAGPSRPAVTAAAGLPAHVAYTMLAAPGAARGPAAPHGIRDIAYFPAHAGWTNMWDFWNPKPINADFARIAALGGNTVRVNLPPDSIGYPHPKAIMMRHLAQLVQLAAAHKLRIDLELFEWFTNYTDIEGSSTWAREVLHPYVNSPHIAFIALQNEMRLDSPVQVTWAKALIPVIKATVINVPLTISVTEYKELPLLDNMHLLRAFFPPGSGLNFLDYHFYFGGHSELAYAVIKQARAIAAPYALFIGETGFSTDPQSKPPDGVPATPAALEAYQDYFLRTLEHVTSSLGLPAAAPWTLSDFAPGAIPSRTSASRGTREYHIGLFRVNGSPKPIVRTLTRMFHGKGQDLSFNNGFEASTPLTITANAPLFPLDWRLYNGDQVQAGTDTTTAHSGKASLKLGQSSGSPSDPPGVFLFPINGEAQAGQRFTATVWAKGQAATGSNGLMLSWVDISHHVIASTPLAAAPQGSFGWQQLKASGAAPSGAVAVSINLVSAQNSGSVWFDDVTFARS